MCIIVYTGTVWTGVVNLRESLQQQRYPHGSSRRTDRFEDGALRAAAVTRVNAAAEDPLDICPIRIQCNVYQPIVDELYEALSLRYNPWKFKKSHLYSSFIIYYNINHKMVRKVNSAVANGVWRTVIKLLTVYKLAHTK